MPKIDLDDNKKIIKELTNRGFDLESICQGKLSLDEQVIPTLEELMPVCKCEVGDCKYKVHIGAEYGPNGLNHNFNLCAYVPTKED